MPDTPRMTSMTIRLSKSVHAALEAEARYEGIALSQYVREAAIFRLGWERGLRSSEPGASARDAILELRERIVADLPPETRGRFWQPGDRAARETQDALREVIAVASDDLAAIMGKVSPETRDYLRSRLSLAGVETPG